MDVAYDRDSYLAGYDYTFEIPQEAQSWLHSFRDAKMAANIKQWPGLPYYMDDGVYFWAPPLPSGVTTRSAVVTCVATKNTAVYNQLYPNGDGPNVCERSRMFVRQGVEEGNTVVQYNNPNSVSIGFKGAQDVTNTHVNIAVASDMIRQSYWANNTIYGESVSQDYLRLVKAEGDTVIIDFAYMQQKWPASGGNTTFDIYATWEGVGTNANLIPVPSRVGSSSVDIVPNSDMSVSKSVNVLSFGNMNVDTTHDLDSSNPRNEMQARCSKIATVVFNNTTKVVTISRVGSDQLGGILPLFYPTTYSNDGASQSFIWSSASTPSSVERTFEPVPVAVGSSVTVNVTSYNNWNTSDSSKKVPYYVYMSSNTAANEYTVNNTVI